MTGSYLCLWASANSAMPQSTLALLLYCTEAFSLPIVVASVTASRLSAAALFRLPISPPFPSRPYGVDFWLHSTASSGMLGFGGRYDGVKPCLLFKPTCTAAFFKKTAFLMILGNYLILRATASNHYLLRVVQSSDDGYYPLLRIFHSAEPHRATDLHVLPQYLSCACRHILEYSVFNLFTGTLKSQCKSLVSISQDSLDQAVVQR